jgi:hypothetical protein
MKKRILLFVVLAFAFALIFALAACADTNENEGATLDAPTNLRLDGDFLRWNSVIGASSYIVKLNGDEFPATIIAFELNLEAGDHTASVRAVASDNRVSAWSQDFNFKIDPPAPPHECESPACCICNDKCNAHICETCEIVCNLLTCEPCEKAEKQKGKCTRHVCITCELACTLPVCAPCGRIAGLTVARDFIGTRNATDGSNAFQIGQALLVRNNAFNNAERAINNYKDMYTGDEWAIINIQLEFVFEDFESGIKVDLLFVMLANIHSTDNALSGLFLEIYDRSGGTAELIAGTYYFEEILYASYYVDGEGEHFYTEGIILAEHLEGLFDIEADDATSIATMLPLFAINRFAGMDLTLIQQTALTAFNNAVFISSDTWRITEKSGTIDNINYELAIDFVGLMNFINSPTGEMLLGLFGVPSFDNTMIDQVLEEYLGTTLSEILSGNLPEDTDVRLTILTSKNDGEGNPILGDEYVYTGLMLSMDTGCSDASSNFKFNLKISPFVLGFADDALNIPQVPQDVIDNAVEFELPELPEL